MRTDVNGISTCARGAESYEEFKSSVTGKPHCQYDYRTDDGALFSTVAESLTEARAQRDAWIAERALEWDVAHVVGQLSMADVVYAGSPARGESRGFAALHDRTDANMLLPGAEDADPADEEWMARANRTIAAVTDRIVATFDGLPECPRCHGETTITLHVLSATSDHIEKTHVLTCPTCEGGGRVSSVALAAFLREEQEWCSCGKTENARFVPDGASDVCAKHHWVCDHCGRIAQVG